MPGGLPIRLVFAYGSLPAAHSAGCPGEAVYGYGLLCSGPCSSSGCSSPGVVYGRLDGVPSPPGTSSTITEKNRSVVPVMTFSDTALAVLRRNSVR